MKAGVEIFGFITMTLSFFGLADIIFEILSYKPPNLKKTLAGEINFIYFTFI